MKRTYLARKSKSEKAKIKDRIQALCRAIAIKRDKGCFLRHYADAGGCGPRRKDGEIVLQYDHLNSRIHSVSFGDTRLGICICARHHGYWKPQYPAKYETYVRDFIGEKRTELIDKVRADNKPYKMDWKVLELSLIDELKKMGE